MANGSDQHTPSPDSNAAHLRAEYGQTASAFGLLTNIRFTLLGLLPVGTGAAVGVVLANSALLATGVIGLFGLTVTLALFIYNERNDQHYGELAGRAAYLERAMGIKDGSFGHRPTRWLKALGVCVAHGWPIKPIYGASMSAWLYLAILPIATWVIECVLIPSLTNKTPTAFYFQQSLTPAPVDHVVSLLIAIWAIWIINKSRERKISERKRQSRKAAAKAVMKLKHWTVAELRALVLDMLNAEEMCSKRFKKLLGHLLCLASAKSKSELTEKDYQRILLKLRFYLADTTNGNAREGIDQIDNASFYWDVPAPGEKLPPVAGAQLISLVTNMPNRWIFDTCSGRTGVFDRENPAGSSA